MGKCNSAYQYQAFKSKTKTLLLKKSHENFDFKQIFRRYKQPKYTYKGIKKCADSINWILKCKSEQLVNAT